MVQTVLLQSTCTSLAPLASVLVGAYRAGSSVRADTAAGCRAAMPVMVLVHIDRSRSPAASVCWCKSKIETTSAAIKIKTITEQE
jgi:hypothetical protein